MNYRHIFHAGNFADVFKHWILTLILSKLIEKENAFCYLDVHAGLGVYNLEHVNARKTLEAELGINLMLNSNEPIFATYLEIVQQLRTQQGNWYPGSPKIAEHFLRSHDRMFLAELHIDDYRELCSNFNRRQIKIFNQNGYEMLKANLPPLEKRGLVLFDPSFEASDEFAQIISALQEAHKRFAHGIYTIWYPIKDYYVIKQFYRNLQQIGFSKILCVEMHTQAKLTTTLGSCGMLIINAPWKLAEQINLGMPKLLQQLNFKHGHYSITEL
jgi:23S rRNA (adenine2030-N6)-methyltransferase